MNDLGTLLAWSALQATLLALAAAVVYPFAARRRPAAGAAVAAAGVVGPAVLTLLALCPLPSWWAWRMPTAVAPASQAARADRTPAVEPPPGAESEATAAPTDGWSWPAGLVKLTWEGAGRAAAPFTDRSQSGWAIVATLFMTGAAFGLLRLGGGLWAVFDLRRRSRPVHDGRAIRWTRRMREKMGCYRKVALRECPGIGVPSAAGWLRPVVLLPPDWRDWTDAELRAALAHELAHVRRRDYLVGLLARLGLAIHFYHPLLYWLAGRLRLQQELAADGLAAVCVGGRGAYLLGLSRLALRLNDRRSGGLPVNPLFSPGTLMRRIRMLRIKDGRFRAPVPRWGRVAVVVLLAAIGVGASALRCPAQKADESAPPRPAVAFVDGGRVEEKGAAPAEAPEPFDLTYLPPDAMGVACFRPSAVLGRPALKKRADEADKGIAAACKAFQLPRTFGLPVEEIAQVSMTFRVTTRVTTDKNADGPRSALLFGAPVMIRATKDFDWAKELKELIPGVTEVKRGDFVIRRLPKDGPLGPVLGPKQMCYYVPDDRTIVFDTEDGLVQTLHRKAGPVWAADFKRVERGLAAVVFDNRDGAWGRELAARDRPEPHVAPFLSHTSWVMVGLSAGDDFTCDVSARFDGEATAEKAATAIGGGLAAARGVLATPQSFGAALGAGAKDFDDPPAGHPFRKTYAFFKALVQEPELKCEGASVHLRCRAKCDITEILAAILDGKIGP